MQLDMQVLRQLQHSCPGLAACTRPGLRTAAPSRLHRLVAAQAQRSPRPQQPEHSRRREHSLQPAASSRSETDAEDENTAKKLAAPIGLVVGLAVLLGAGFLFKGQIRGFVDYFITVVDDLGPLGYAAYGAVYVGLELLAVPAIPLTMTSGVIFGVVPGTIVVSVASVAAATLAFLIARYLARDRVLDLAEGNDQFKVIDRAIGKNSFKIVTLLRLSPLLPLALSNYFYGLTSVPLPAYVGASWLGMLPGTIAYVTAGSYGRTVLDGGEGELALEWWQVALGAAVTLGTLGYLARIAKDALDEAKLDMD